MGQKGAGGRWIQADESDAGAGEERQPPPNLSGIELVCFAAMIGLVFWLAQQLAARGASAKLFQNIAYERHVFASLALSLGAYQFALSGSAVPKLARIAGAMLASVVSVALMYVLLFLGTSLYLAGAAIALAAGSALQSRTGIPRDQAYPSALIAASVLMIAYAATASFTR